ncbi:MAG: pyridoxal-phosphate dependent enzyme, partial [Acidimicrobiales bacterium]
MSVRRDQMASLVVCRGCGWVVPDSEPYPFACPAAGDAGDHVLHRVLDFDTVSFPDAAGTEAQPFVRYRGLLHARHLAVAGGLGDDAFVRIVRDLDGEVARIEGRGIIETPFALQLALGEAVGLGGPLFVKDETGNVAGSHKARHLFGVLVHLEVVEQIGLASRGDRPLAIASCGNAALAAAVVAAAGCRELHVFVPTDADAAVVDRLSDLG